TVTLESGDAVDLLSLSGFKVGERFYPDAPAGASPEGQAARWPLFAGIAAALLVAGALLLVLRRRRTASVATLLGLALLLAAGRRPLPAHG
ncbi:hypothetical protein, partial [Enterococcus casseliflavus]|uniref:hypothetical protein n=1 Tax=Enterococcus casseliflavus TaxID=37734 RepID=UPI003D0EA921